jgi:hypothetical protein
MFMLALHLLYTNSDLLALLEPNKVQHIWMRWVFAASYSLITVLILNAYPRLWLLLILASFDGFGVYLKYNVYQTYFTPTAAVYFGLYTALIVISSGLASRKPVKKYKARIAKP